MEITESVAPVLVTERELRIDSGGPGRQRGGLGQRLGFRSAGGEAFLVFVSVDRIRHPARGRDGGGNGAPGRIYLKDGPDLPGKGTARIEPGRTLYFETPGGGGFGNPQERAREAIETRPGPGPDQS